MKTDQPELPLIHFPFQEYLGGFNRVRKSAGPVIEAMRWTQLTLTLHLRALCRIAKNRFVWSQPDGQQVVFDSVWSMVINVVKMESKSALKQLCRFMCI